jgi:hypothetical protein
MKRYESIMVVCLLSAWTFSQTSPSGLQVYDGCPLGGDAKGTALQKLNQLKNRYIPPRLNQFNPSITLQAILAPGDDTNRWSPAMGAEITGFVLDVKPGGSETVNCHAKDPAHTDTHIEIVLNPNDSAPARRVIVEVTPRGRAIMAAKQRPVNWSTATLRRTLLGKRITVQGWMMFDAQHSNAAENTAPGHAGNWRATAWEVHPVTGIRLAPPPTP